MADREYELPKPSPVANGKTAVEVLRAWQVDGVLHISMHSGLLNNPFGCGVMLADTARVIADAEEHHPEKTAAQAFADVRYGFFEAFAPRPKDVPADFPSLASYSKIVKLFHEESDRAAGVLAGSFMETYLRKCLEFYFVEHASVKDLFREFGPFGSFAARIGVAFAVGLLTESMRSDLKYIKDVRNHFAHHPDDTSFNVSPVRDLCQNFSFVDAMRDKTPRELYLFAISGVAAQLNNAMLVAQRRRRPEQLGA